MPWLHRMQQVSGGLEVGDLRGLVLAAGRHRQLSMMGLAPRRVGRIDPINSSAPCPAQTGCTCPRGKPGDELLLGLA